MTLVEYLVTPDPLSLLLCYFLWTGFFFLLHIMTRYPKSARLPLTLTWTSTTALNDFYDLGVLCFSPILYQ